MSAGDVVNSSYEPRKCFYFIPKYLKIRFFFVHLMLIDSFPVCHDVFGVLLMVTLFILPGSCLLKTFFFVFTIGV